jgi:tetratricopeptide (TPR) repeat protein
LRNLPDLDIESHCLFLLNEQRCCAELGQHEMAERLLDKVEKIDTSRQFHLNVEHIRITELHHQRKFAEANKRSRRFLQENAEKLASLDFAIIAYEQKLELAMGLVQANEFTEGLQMLNELLPVAEEQHIRDIHYFRGFAYQQLGQHDSAIDEFKQVLAQDNHDSWTAGAHYCLGEIYASKEVFARAKQHLKNAETLKDFLNFPVSYVYTLLGNVCFKLNELDEGWRYRKLSESEPAASATELGSPKIH